MKVLFLVSSLFVLSIAHAKRDIDIAKFNEAMHENIDSYVKQNPEKYETKDLIRKPASVEVEGEEVTPKKVKEKSSGFERYQYIGGPKW
jgi:hypothetical protein